MHVLELKVPPVGVVLVAAALMWVASGTVPALEFTLPACDVVAALFAAAGLAVGVMGIVSFARAKTTVNPMKPGAASSLVVSGIYRYSRNPMYLGLLLLLLGWAWYLSNALAFLLLPGFILYMNRFQIEPEERALASLFGEAFTAYRARVRRWL
ncbi:MAG: isoprenylcysteine carboxylmethyltransferase family protein [Nitrospirae bacterium]|nr:MAG: isoprenylcysteine carboxylmethyltransferase family protein [Nitrospirota bacterium]